jgi:uncharacterized membrane protein YgdD (TMEM256/DUF423 family)
MRIWIVVAGLNGMMGVAMAAVGAHAFVGAHASVGDGLAQGWVERASHFQLLHALALLAADRFPIPAALFLAGIVGFSGSLYLKAFGLVNWVPGLITPAGGVCLMLGWGTLALAGAFGRRR